MRGERREGQREVEGKEEWTKDRMREKVQGKTAGRAADLVLPFGLGFQHVCQSFHLI